MNEKNGMWKKLKNLILQDVKNENEVKMYAVILRVNLLLMIFYYTLLAGRAVWNKHLPASLLGTAGTVLCALLLYVTYHNKTKAVAYVYNVSFTVLIVSTVLLYGNNTGIYNFMYVQIILVYALDYLSFKNKLLYTASLIAVRICLFDYKSRYAALYQLSPGEELFAQGMHMLMISALLVVTVTVSTQDFRGMQKKLIAYNEKLRDIAGIDPLTGLRNRRSGIEYMEKHVRKYKAGEADAMTVAIGDIDFFKRINDTYGHNCGDVVLRELAEAFSGFMAGKGSVCRWGGEEFLFIFYNVNGDESCFMLQELRKTIQKMAFYFEEKTIRVTMTFGVAEYDLRRETEATIEEADQKLYMGKKKGRDMIIY